MTKGNLTNKHEAVIDALKKEHLTSFQILNKVKSISLILVVYTIIDELKKMGLIKSYIKEDIKYHYCIA